MGGLRARLSLLAGVLVLLVVLVGESPALTGSGPPPASADPLGTPVKGRAVRRFNPRDLPPASDPGPGASPGRRLTLDKRALGDQKAGPRAPEGSPAQGPLAPEPVLVGDSFQGLQMFGIEPPDPQLAAGPTKLIEMVNVRGQIYDKDGGELGTPFSLAGPSGFFEIPAVYEFSGGDPLVDYDVLSGRFFAVLIASDIQARTGLVAVAVSASNDPEGDWMVYHFTKTEYFPDFPKMGISGDKVVVTANGFDIDDPCGSTCDDLNEYWVLDKNDLLAFAPTVDSRYFTHQCGGTFCYHTIMPAVSLSATDTIYMGTLNLAIEATTLTVFTVTGNPSANNVIVVSADLAIPGIGPPLDAEQPDVGNRIATNYQDMVDAVWRDGHLWLAGSKNCSGSWIGGTAAGACLYLFDILTGPMTINRSVTVEDPGKYVYFPGITVGSAGQVLGVMTRSSADDYAGVFAFIMHAGEAPGPLVQIKAGESGYPGSRWGDYHGASIDPNNQSRAWVVGEYAAPAGRWGTWIAELITPAPPGPPAAPTWSNANSTSTSQIQVQWNDNANNETGYQVFRLIGGAWNLRAQLPANSTSYTETGLSSNTAHLFLVGATNTFGTTYSAAPMTAVTQGIVPIPPDMSWAAGTSSSQMRVAWVDKSNNETGFKVHRYIGGGAQWELIATLPAGSTTYDDSGLAPGTYYGYWVWSVSSDGNGYATNIVYGSTLAASPDPLAPRILSAVPVSQTQIQVNWSDNTADEAGFIVFRLVGGAWSEVGRVAPNVTSFTDGGATSATINLYLIWVHGPSYGKPSSNTMGAWPTANRPVPPRLVGAWAISTTQVRVKWSDNSNNETGFKVLRYNPISGQYDVITTTGVGQTTFTDGGRAPGTWYAYWVWSTNAQGDSYAPIAVAAQTWP